MNFDQWFIAIAHTISLKSKDQSTKVGAVIVSRDNKIKSAGYNGFPAGSNDQREDWYARPKKYLVTSHAEENAILFAARHGVSTNNCKIYVTHVPCATCTRMIAQAGIKEIYVDKETIKKDEEFNRRWEEDFKAAGEIREECKIKLKVV